MNRPDETAKYITVLDGVELLSIEGMALLCDVDIDVVNAEFQRQQVQSLIQFAIPKSWVRSAKALQARLGTSDFHELIRRAHQARGN